MDFLYFSDIHLYHKNPSSRVDDYASATLKKLEEIVDIANKNEVEFVLFGGDFFHKSTVPNEYATKVIRVLNKLNCNMYVCLGNHDLRGHNIDTLNTTTIGVIASSGVITILDNEIGEVLEFDIYGHSVAIEGSGYKPRYDKFENDSYDITVEADYNIMVAHGMLTPNRMMDEIEHTCIEDIECPADLTFCGHDHSGFDRTEYEGNMFVNCGSISRVDMSKHMKKHTPSIMLCRLSVIDNEITTKFKKIHLKTVENFDDVFAKKEEANKFASDLKSLEDISTDYDNIEDIASELTESREVLDSSLMYIDKAGKELGKDEIVDYIKSNEEKIIDSVKLINFKSHANTVVEFTKGLNAIIGTNDVGKSTILKAIEWVVNDTPKGNGFIRTGQTKCEVSITFTDGTYIRKTRNSTGSAYYAFNGEREEEYRGFANRLPVELVNIHQMPLVKLWGKDNSDKVSINYASQIDSLFLLGTKATNRAQALGKLTNTDIIDKGIQDVSKDIKNESTALSKKIKETKALEEAVLSLKEKEEKLKGLLERAQETKESNDCILEAQDKSKSIINRISKAKVISKEISKLESLIEDEFRGIDELGNSVLRLRMNILKFIRYRADIKTIKETTRDIDISNKDVALRVISLSDKLSKRSIAIKRIKETQSLTVEVKADNFEYVEQITTLKEKLKKLSVINGTIVREEEGLLETEGEIALVDMEIYRIKEEIKDSTCPTCGKVIGE